jgi:uncharacterized protein involved in exopolysaccharide biosynthesis
MNLLYVIRQRRRLLWGVFLAVAVVYFIYEFALVREYSAFAQVRAAHGGVAANADLNAYQQDFTAHVQLVQSAGFLQGMAERLSDDDRRQILAPFGHWFGATETAGEVLLEHRIVAPNPSSQIIDLGFTHPNPAVAAKVANAMAAEFVRQSDAMNEAQKKKMLGDLQTDVEKLNHKLETLQSQMDGYQNKFGAAKFDLSETGADFSGLQQLSRKAVDNKAALDKLDLQRQQIQQQVLAGQPLWEVSFIAAQPDVQRLMKDLHDFNTRLDEMRHEQYAEDSPPMVELKGRITSTGTQLASAADVFAKQVASDYDAAMTTTNQAVTRLEDARKQAQDLSSARAEYEKLHQDYDATQKLVAAKAISLSDQTAQVNFSMATYSLLASAEPPTKADAPSWVRFLLNALGVGVGGSMLTAVGLALFRPPPAAERQEHERRRRRHRHFHSSTRHREKK